MFKHWNSMRQSKRKIIKSLTSFSIKAFRPMHISINLHFHCDFVFFVCVYFFIFLFLSIELLWTSPELLRNPKGPNKFGTQAGDVYSFGIIMQEVVVRGEPYCMLSLSAEEIISKLKKPPPLIRPSVSKGAAPPEAINIMRQCWAETPDMRPDFNSWVNCC